MSGTQCLRLIGRWSRLFGTVVLLATLPLHLGVSPASAAESSSVLTIAKYATATASHDRPAHAVTSDDVSNAVSTPLINPTIGNASPITLVANIGDLAGSPRVAAFLDTTRYTTTFVDFPNSVGATPAVTHCPQKALDTWTLTSNALDIARNAVAAAAAHDRAVSGADVVRATYHSGLTLARVPTFASGRGGRVMFSAKVTSGTPAFTTKVTVCVALPTTAYGIPRAVLC